MPDNDFYESMKQKTLRWLERTGRTPCVAKQEVLEQLRILTNRKDLRPEYSERYKKKIARIEALSADEYYVEYVKERIAARGRLTM